MKKGFIVRQAFLPKPFWKKIIQLAVFSGIHYDNDKFYFDKVNELIKHLSELANIHQFCL